MNGSTLQEVGVLSYSGLSSFQSHDMAMRCSPGDGLVQRTV